MINDTVEYLKLSDKNPVDEKDGYVKYELSQDEYAKIFTLLDRNESNWSEDSEEVDDGDEDTIVTAYHSKWGTLLLTANLEDDTYALEITEEDDND